MHLHYFFLYLLYFNCLWWFFLCWHSTNWLFVLPMVYFHNCLSEFNRPLVFPSKHDGVITRSVQTSSIFICGSHIILYASGNNHRQLEVIWKSSYINMEIDRSRTIIDWLIDWLGTIIVVLFSWTSSNTKIMSICVLLFHNYSHKISHLLFSKLF